MVEAIIQSEGDLEIVLLYESHGALASIIGKGSYTISGDAPNQEIWFPDERRFGLFLILLVELFAEGRDVVTINGSRKNLGLLDGLGWLDQKHRAESEGCGLNAALTELRNWLDTETQFEVWCPDIDLQVSFPITRRDLIWFGANHEKHSLLRLSGVLSKLARKLEVAGIVVPHQHTVHVLNTAIEEIRNRLLYHSTYIIEMLGALFISINRIMLERFAANPTNRVDDMVMPEGVTSDVFRNLYGEALVFKRYDEQDRIRALVPVTNPVFKLRY
ncbi:MAG: hypothetical protein F4Y62_09850 [Rhodospirillaceae bacterium]|nr:hypothetical protein [Rhodospirillaceae bacterium]MYK15581.1 hypothetical protein [Rhodospirillaceae bacterium]